MYAHSYQTPKAVQLAVVEFSLSDSKPESACPRKVHSAGALYVFGKPRARGSNECDGPTFSKRPQSWVRIRSCSRKYNHVPCASSLAEVCADSEKHSPTEAAAGQLEYIAGFNEVLLKALHESQHTFQGARLPPSLA